MIAALGASQRGAPSAEPAAQGHRALRVALAPRAPATAEAPPAAPAGAETPAPAPGEAATGAADAPAPLALSAPRYFHPRELDVRPGILVRVEPEYPEAAARRFLSGRVVARLLIDEQGQVEQVVIVQSEPPGYFEAPARQAFMAARFSPGMKAGRAVRVQMLLEINFESPQPPALLSPAS